MRALVSHVPGGPETLRLDELPGPVAGPGELLVRVRACAINYPDVLIIEDKYQLRPPRPFAPGSEIAGEVEAAGEGVSGWSPGDRIIAATGFGGLAEKVVIPAERAIPLPPERSFEEGSALLLTYATAIHALLDRGRIEEGDTLLVLGAAGGVGIAAVELGKALGARVVAAVSSDEKASAAMNAGADAALVYPQGPFDRDGQKTLAALFKDAVGPDGADLIFDPVGGDYSEAALRSIAWQGRFLVVGFPAGSEAAPQPHFAQKLRCVRRVLGRVRRPRSRAQRRAYRDIVPAVGRRQDRAQDQRNLPARTRRRGDRHARRPPRDRQGRGYAGLTAPAAEQVDQGRDEEAECADHEDQRDDVIFGALGGDAIGHEGRRVSHQLDVARDPVKAEPDGDEYQRLESHRVTSSRALKRVARPASPSGHSVRGWNWRLRA